jgi:hypothetical protein
VDVLRSKGVGEVAVGPRVTVDGGDGAGHVHPRVLKVAYLALGRGDRAQEVRARVATRPSVLVRRCL